MTPSTMPADSTLNVPTGRPNQSWSTTFVMNCRAKKPYTTEGMPASSSSMGLSLRRVESLAYSAR